MSCRGIGNPSTLPPPLSHPSAGLSEAPASQAPTSFAGHPNCGAHNRGAHGSHALTFNPGRRSGAGRSQSPEKAMCRFEAIVGALAACLMTLTAIAPASADPVQSLYDPPVGSRWTVH